MKITRTARDNVRLRGAGIVLASVHGRSATDAAAATAQYALPSSHPARLWATYNRYGGVRHMIAGLDLTSGHVLYRLRDRKRSQEFLAFLRELRVRFPRGRLYVVCDNTSPHHKVTVADWCADHDAELVFTPTYASWLS